MLRELNCKRADTARACVDQRLLPVRHVRALDERLPRGQPDQRDRRGFLHRERFGLVRDGVFSYCDVFRERADAIFRQPRIDLVAGFEPAHASSDLGDDTRHFVPQDEGHAIRQDELHLSVSRFDVQRVHAGSADVDQQTAGTGISAARTASLLP